MYKISVIIPIYNAGLNLKKCIDSIVNQTYKNIEIILVDDGSTDNSLDICKKYKSIDNRIILIHQKNYGVSHARNVGIENSSGDYLSFIDSDDYLELDCYEKVINCISKSKCEIVSFAINFEDKKGIKSNEIIKASHDMILKTKGECFIQTKFEPIMWRCCNKVFKRNIIVQKNIKFNTKTNQGEDGLFVLNILDSNDNISMYYINELLYNYVQYDSSSSHKISEKKMIEWLNTLHEYINIYRKNNIYCDDIKIIYMTNFRKAKMKYNNDMLNSNQVIFNEYKKEIRFKNLNLKQKFKLFVLKF